MKLDQYLKDNRLTDKEFGARIGRGQSSVTRLRRGETLPDWETARRISVETGGLVMPNDFLPETPPATQAAQ